MGQSPKELHYQGYVNDFAHVISPDTKAALNTLCEELDKKADAQIAVVTVRSLEHESAQQYAFDLATRWGVGPKQSDRGVLILASRDHHYWVEVGYGLEPILPDGLVGHFGREALPQFRIGNYSGAILLLTERVAAVIAKDRGVTLEALLQNGTGSVATEAPPPATPQNLTLRLSPLLLLLFFPLLGFLLRRRAGRRYGRGHGVIWAAAPWFLGGGGFGGGGGSWGSGGFGGGGGFGGFGGGSFGGGGAGGSW